MPVPLIAAAAAAAARIAAKKVAQRAVGGITGAGAKSINKVYKQMGPTKSQKDTMRHEIRIDQEKLAAKQYKEHLKSLNNF